MTSSAVWTPDLLPWWSALISRPPSMQSAIKRSLAVSSWNSASAVYHLSGWHPICQTGLCQCVSVRVGKSSSAAVPVHVDVPQGSVLWPILFTTTVVASRCIQFLCLRRLPPLQTPLTTRSGFEMSPIPQSASAAGPHIPLPAPQTDR